MGTFDVEDNDEMNQTEWSQFKMNLRENRQKGNPMEYAEDFRNFIQACGAEASEVNEDLTFTFGDIDNCAAELAGADGNISVDSWGQFMDKLGDYGENREYSYKSMKKACKVKGSDMTADQFSNCWDKHDKDDSEEINVEEFSKFWKRFMKYNDRVYRGLPDFKSMVHFCELSVNDGGAITNQEFTQCFSDKTASDSLTGTSDLDNHNWEQFNRALRNVEMEHEKMHKKNAALDKQHRKDLKNKQSQLKKVEKEVRKVAYKAKRDLERAAKKEAKKNQKGGRKLSELIQNP